MRFPEPFFADFALDNLTIVATDSVRASVKPAFVVRQLDKKRKGTAQVSMYFPLEIVSPLTVQLD